MLRTACIFSLAALLAGCGGTSDTPMCQASTTPQAASAFCAPPAAAANQALRLQVREQCGGCTQHADHCEVQVSGQNVHLRLLGQSCTLPPNSACPALCSINTIDCMVPALPAGTYQVSTDAGTTMVQTMTLDVSTSATACTIPGP